MPRPRKCRKVCSLPKMQAFFPSGNQKNECVITLTVDEYETIRLIDREGFSQETCGEFMQIARATVQQTYNTARKKLADMLVEGCSLRIEGGDYRLCDGKEERCGCGGCPRHRCTSSCSAHRTETEPPV